jgi:hypothetical protein
MPPVPQRTRIDWNAARAFYVSLPTTDRSFARVAREYHVTTHTVGKHARREGWVEAAAEADRRAGAKALEATMRTREQRAVQTARLRDLAADALEGEFAVDDRGNVTSSLDPAVRVQVWKEADRQYRLDIGEVTDRISIPEVRDFVAGFVNQVDELLVAVLEETLGENGKRAVVIRAFRERMPGVLEQAAAIEGSAS